MGKTGGMAQGFSKTKLYRIWMGMRFRCAKGDKYFDRHYVERGINVCDEWRDNFLAFREWALANGYRDGLTIDRVDNYGDYCPENCRFATMAEQNRNRTNNIRIEYRGETKTLAEWSRDVGINYQTLIYRFKKMHMTPEEAFNTPIMDKNENLIVGRSRIKHYDRLAKKQAEEDAVYGYC